MAPQRPRPPRVPAHRPARGAVIVTLPLRAARKAGMALLMGHADWVADRLAALPDVVPFVDGALVPLDGVPHRIRHAPAARGGACLEDGNCVSGAAEFLSRRVPTSCAPRPAAACRPGR